MNKFSLLKERIKINEGFRNIAYLDSLGFLTVGYGHLIRKNEKQLFNKKLSKKFLLKVFDSDFNKALKKYKQNFNTKKHPYNIQETLIEMIFQLGIKKQKKFIKMNKHIKNNQLFLAALEMKNSLWYKQTPKRVDDLIKILLKKEYEKKR